MTLDSSFEGFELPRVSIVRILPNISEKELFIYKQSYIGISLENPVFEEDSLRALLWWSVKRFQKSMIIIGDYLCRFNEKLLNGHDAAKASQVAQELGDSFLSQSKEIFEQLPNKKICLTRWNEHLKTKEYKESKAMLDNLFASDSEFRASIEKDAFSFVKRQKRHNQKLAVEIEKGIELCCEYLLEEIGVFSALSEQGWHVELYPGPELRVLREVAKGKYPGVPRGLKERVSVELKITANIPH